MTDTELLDLMSRCHYVEVSNNGGDIAVIWRLNDPYSKRTLREALERFFHRLESKSLPPLDS